MSPEDRAETHRALETTQGHQRQAAELMDIPLLVLKNRIHNDRELKLRWATANKEVEAPGEAVTVHRPKIPKAAEALPTPEEEMAVALQAEDKMVARGVEAMGLAGREAAIAEKWRRASGQHYTSVLQMISGGLAYQVIDLEVMIEDINEELKEIKLHGEKEGTSREFMLRQDRASLLGIKGKTVDQAQRAALTRAQIRAKLNDKGQKHKKPGFLAIQAQAGSKVTVVTNDQDPMTKE